LEKVLIDSPVEVKSDEDLYKEVSAKIVTPKDETL